MNRADRAARTFAAAALAGIAAALVVCLVGCGHHDQHLREKARLGAWLALNVAKVAPPQGVPSPDKPDQGDTCPDCGGLGRLPGDGVVRPVCTTCNGTGRKPAADFDPPASAEAFQAEELRREAVERAAREDARPKAAPKPERYAVPPKDGRTYRKVCRGGECAWEPIQ